MDLYIIFYILYVVVTLTILNLYIKRDCNLSEKLIELLETQEMLGILIVAFIYHYFIVITIIVKLMKLFKKIV